MSDSAQAPGTGGDGRVVLAVGVAAVTALVFAPSLQTGFVEWDDTGLLVDNAAYRGLGWGELRWMASSVLLGHYAPVTWLSFAVDFLVWGVRPFGFHLTNVVLHAVNAGLVVVLARRLLARASRLPPAARDAGAVLAALVFAVHPLRVEAVTWLTGRRDVLSGFWFLVTLLCYLRAEATEGRPRRGWLAGSIAAFALALLAKTIVMGTPIVLVVLDIYPLRRLPGNPRRWAEPALRRVWSEKIPFGLLATGAAVISYRAARGSGIVLLDGWTWLALVWTTLWFQVEKTLAPFGLSPLYELPARMDPWAGAPLRAGLLVTLVSVTLVWVRRGWPAGFAAWTAGAVFLAPVCGMAHAGPQITADRYTYLPALGWALVTGGGVAWLVARRAWVTVGLTGLVLAGLPALTIRQEAIWRDAGTLWKHAVAVTPDCTECRVNFGNWLHAHGREAEAIAEYEASLALRPDRVGVHTNVGLVLVRLGRAAEALPHYEQVLARHPDWLGVRLSLASALISLGRRPEAVARLGEATRIGSPVALVEALRMQVAARPADPAPRLGLVEAYLAAGDRARAAVELRELERLDPDLARLVAMSVARRRAGGVVTRDAAPGGGAGVPP